VYVCVCVCILCVSVSVCVCVREYIDILFQRNKDDPKSFYS